MENEINRQEVSAGTHGRRLHMSTFSFQETVMYPDEIHWSFVSPKLWHMQRLFKACQFLVISFANTCGNYWRTCVPESSIKGRNKLPYPIVSVGFNYLSCSWHLHLLHNTSCGQFVNHPREPPSVVWGISEIKTWIVLCQFVQMRSWCGY